MLNNKIITAYTDGSAKPNPGYAGYGIYISDEEKNEVFIYSGIEPQKTNNFAEITAVIKFLEYIQSTYTKNELKEINVYSDSKYTLDGIKWIKGWEKNNWLTSTGQPVQNKDLFIRLAELVNIYKDVINFFWVRGHAGIYGNEHANTLAEKGRKESEKGNYEQQFYSINQIDDKLNKEVVVSNEKLYAVTRFLSGDRWFFRTGMPKISTINGADYYTYLTSSFDEPTIHKNDKQLADHDKFLKRCRNIGKRAPDSHYAIILTKDPIPGIESLRTKLDEQNVNDHVPIVLKLSTLLGKTLWTESLSHNHGLTTTDNNVVVSKDGTHLGGFFIPPKLVFKMEETFSLGFTLLDTYLKNPAAVSVDITDHLFDTKEGKVAKQVIKPEFTNGTEYLDINLNHDKINKPITVRLTPNIDIPNRNAFSGLLKVSNEPIKISIMLIEITNQSYRFVTFIEQSGTIGLYFTPEANLSFY